MPICSASTRRRFWVVLCTPGAPPFGFRAWGYFSMALRATADKIKKGASRPSRGLLWLLVCFYLVLLVCRLEAYWR